MEYNEWQFIRNEVFQTLADQHKKLTKNGRLNYYF